MWNRVTILASKIGEKMSFNAETTIQQINHSMNAMLLLHSSCQAIIEVSIEQVDSSWYNTLDQELGKAENLVLAWRQNGYLYFHQLILQEITNYGQSFDASKATIDALFVELENNYSKATKLKLINSLTALISPLKTMISQITEYQTKLQIFETQMQKPHGEMNKTIAQVQAQEQQIQSRDKFNKRSNSRTKKTNPNRPRSNCQSKKSPHQGNCRNNFWCIIGSSYWWCLTYISRYRCRNHC